MGKFIFILATVLAVPAFAEEQTFEIKLRARVLGVCDMDRNPDSPECLELIEPAVGEEAPSVSVEHDGLYEEVIHNE